MSYDLEKNILKWKKGLRKYQAFDDGDIKEYEQHLRDEIKSMIESGLGEKEAFKQAVKNLGKTREMASEISKVNQSPNTLKRVSYAAELSILNLLPNYLKVAFRNIFRSKFYSFINISSITIGIVVSVMVLQYFFYETNYDAFYEDNDRVYRIITNVYNKEGVLNFVSATNFPALASTLLEEAPTVEAATNITGTQVLMRRNDNIFQETGMVYSESSDAFKIFSIEMLTGNYLDLDRPNTMILSETLASRYFGTEDALGQSIEMTNVIGEWVDAEVVGVYKDIPENTHLRPEGIINGSRNVRMVTDNGNFGNIPYDDIVWRLRNSFTYVKIKEGARVEELQNQLDAVSEKYRGPFDARQGIQTEYEPQLLTSIHLTQGILNEPSPPANVNSLYFIFAIGIGAMIIGWINYVNLSTARSMNRAREIGIRKVVGSSRLQLIIQFLLESSLLNVFGIVLAVLVIFSVVPSYHDVLDINVFEYFSAFPGKWIVFSICLLVGTLLAGLYPAIMFSRFKPISTLKGAFKSSSKGNALRKGLVIFQFTLSIFLLIGIHVIYNQMVYMKNLDKGMNLEHTYVVSGPSLVDGNRLSRYEALKQDLEQYTGIREVVNSTVIPGQAIGTTVTAERVEGTDNRDRVRITTGRVDYNYFDLFDMELVAGRLFERARPTDRNGIILNETAVDMLGYPNAESAIGQHVFRSLGDTVEVIGVLKNFAQQSLQNPFSPIMFQLLAERGYISGIGPTSIKIDQANVDETLSIIEQTFRKHFPGDIYSGFFLEEQYNQSYATEERFEWIFTTFTLLSVLITVLGLVGLSSFLIAQRTKEIGIRKVLGSSTSQIISLIVKDYFKLVLLASIIAIPFAIWWMQDWLKDFPFKIEPGLFTILLPFVVIVLITLFAVSNQTIRAAIARPVKSLKTE